VEGKVIVEGQELSRRDGFGLWDLTEINIKSSNDSHVLLMEVPMNL